MNCGVTTFGFEIISTDPQTHARRGRMRTAHGDVDTPAFMPVGSRAAIKGCLPELVRRTGTQMILSNTYHLLLRPGVEVVAAVGGLHRFMGWDGPILTDSGGFQVYSLGDLVRLDDKGVWFRSHIDGQPVELTPERVIEVQRVLGSDIGMVLDHVVPLPAEIAQLAEATRRTIAWAKRSVEATAPGQIVFGIIQGGLDKQLREQCLRELTAMDFPGYALGGLSVGETPEEMYQVVEAFGPRMPPEKPRYLMGVGRPQDILRAIAAGIDLFDCVIPTRNGRNATAFTWAGKLRLRNAKYRCDPRPIEEGCFCPACADGRFSRAYLRHLFLVGELLGPVLVSLHNVYYYQKLMAECRRAIDRGVFREFAQDAIARLERQIQEQPETGGPSQG
ncbi:MAG: tRNA guanosine(34) transglycosylase Tgt [Thermoguttaceae bacterium]|nr:tRNA guanosine(34) transglycosylase Tgt [Thermoguttaceae bacterium]MDW8077386.1 tRNA guanosine(34) transglycosylase Tgt [Thermoguttaceae bacterium]